MAYWQLFPQRDVRGGGPLPKLTSGGMTAPRHGLQRACYTLMREDDYLTGSRVHQDIGIRGSGGVACNLFDSPAARELRHVLGGDNVQVRAIYPYDETKAKKAKEITHRMDSAWAEAADPPADTSTIKLREWIACTVTVSSPTRRPLQSWRWWPKSTRSVG